MLRQQVLLEPKITRKCDHMIDTSPPEYLIK
jgi:hypothetical protein